MDLQEKINQIIELFNSYEETEKELIEQINYLQSEYETLNAKKLYAKAQYDLLMELQGHSEK